MIPPTQTSFPESEGFPSPQDGLGSAPSSSVKSTPTASGSLQRTFFPSPRSGKTTNEHLPTWLKRHQEGKVSTPPLSLAAQIYGNSMDDQSGGSTSLQGDFLASLSALPGSEEARQMTVTSGLKCCALSRKLDRLGFLERMFLASSRWNSTLCYLTWRPLATPQGRLLFQLAPWMQ